MSADYVKRAKECGLKAGDFVCLTRRARDYEDGWDNVWPYHANDLIGHIWRVGYIHEDGDVKCIWHEGQPDESWCHFPYFVLEKVEGVGEVPEGATLEKWQTFNPGDIVRVTRSTLFDGENGWHNTWVEDMNAWVGKKCRVVRDAGVSGVQCEKLDGNGAQWCFPSFVLEKVSDAETTPEEKKMFNIGDHVRVMGTWLPSGATGRIEAAVYSDVWKVKFDAHKEGRPEWWCYPEEALELIKDKPAPRFVPFETRVLVRAGDDSLWLPAVYGFRAEQRSVFSFVTVGGIHWAQCIPYEGNEHLLGTSRNPKADN